MRIGLQVPYFTWPSGPEALGETFGTVAQRAEVAGFSSFWLMDHYFQIPGVGPAEHDMLEAYTALGFAAAKTSTIKLGTMVTGNTYRAPGLLAKTVTTLDVLSGGRAYLGIGAGWFEREHVGLGVRFGTWTERFEKLEEALQITHQMWNGDNGPFSGKHYQLAETLCVPAPLTKPHPPILIGGRGEKKTLRLVANYADAWNMGTSFDEHGVDEFKRLAAVLRAHCEREERAYDGIEKTVLLTLWISRHGGERWLTPRQAVERFELFREAGVDHAIVNMASLDRPETIDVLAEDMLPAVAKL